ncbi:hypothetical protein GmHk_10G029157 [Glycine max]|nr:hypothetical protein GmHk_10G029157 [Glycine max]
MAMENTTLFVLLLNVLLVFSASLVSAEQQSQASAVGDPGMQRDGLRVAFEAWNFCNEVGQEAPHMGSPRAADCFDLSGTSPAKRIWTSIDSGTEIFVSDKDEVAEWTLSDFDVILTQSGTNLMNKAERKK